MEGRKVKYAKLHTSLFVPEAGDLGDTLDTISKQSKNRRIEMVLTAQGLEFKLDKETGLIPLANVKSLQFSKE